MSNIWYYAEGDQSVGPLSLQDLAAVLLAAPDAGDVLVWRDGLPQWEEAKNLPELVPYIARQPQAREPNWNVEQPSAPAERPGPPFSGKDRRARAEPGSGRGGGGSRSF
jgi:hypothetical protein